MAVQSMTVLENLSTGRTLGRGLVAMALLEVEVKSLSRRKRLLAHVADVRHFLGVPLVGMDVGLEEVAVPFPNGSHFANGTTQADVGGGKGIEEVYFFHVGLEDSLVGKRLSTLRTNIRGSPTSGIIEDGGRWILTFGA